VSDSADFSGFLKTGSDGRTLLELAIDGIVSAESISEIEGSLRQIPGLVTARLNFTTRRLHTEWHDRACDPAPAIKTLERLGYRVAPFVADREESFEDQQTKWLMKCLAIAGFAAINVMLLSICVWAGNVSDITPETRDLFHGLSALIALPAAAFAGQPFFLSAGRALRRGEMNMDVPITIGIVLALAMSVYETAHHAEHAYFDSALMLIFFLLSGRVLDHAMRQRTNAAAANLAALHTPTATRLAPDGSLVHVPSEALSVGDRLLVRPGERLAADGVIVAGEAMIDESLVTGETQARRVSLGDRVYAGTLNGDATLEVTVTAAGGETLLADIARLIDNAVSAKSRYVKFADKIAKIYAPVVHIAAALTAILWIIAGASIHDALIIAIAVLIITCPCALALAAPAVQVVIAGALFRRGILIKSGDVIERMAEIDTIVFDKTGTLTLPESSLVDAASLSEHALMLAGRLALSSHHPLARALRDYAVDRFGRLKPLTDAVEVPGQGIIARVEGQEARLGSAAHCGLAAPIWHDGASVIAFRCGDEAGLITIGQSMRPDAQATIDALKAKGYQLIILSGDQQSAVEEVARGLGVSDFSAALRPQDKLDHLRALKQAGHTVLMVGDGINDAPALAGAHASLAPASGADVTQAAADAVFSGRRLHAVVETLALCKKGRAVMRENFAVALLYNLVAVPFAMAGGITPLIAALAMSGSSIIVTLNALRARQVRGIGE
jgi:P-type Cu2+ transporter